jgi:rhizosphere induced protein
MILDFSEVGVQYSLKCMNQSTTSWYFYIYQRISNQSDNNIYSLAWNVSPYKIGVGAFMTFNWSVNYSFAWFNTGSLKAGIVPMSGGQVPANLETNNSTIFSVENNTPQFSTPISGAPSGQFLTMGANDIPNSTFSTGIGVSGFATLIGQSNANTQQNFNSDATLWVGATTTLMQTTEVLHQDNISNTSEFIFPLNIYSLTATLGENNLWTIA